MAWLTNRQRRKIATGPVKILSEGEKKSTWGKRQRELSVDREKDAGIIKARHAARKEAHENRVDEIRRHAAIDKHNVQSRHRQEINTHWRRQAPRPEMHLRLPAAFTRPMPTLGGEMGRALKGLIHTTHHSTAVVAERRTMEQNKNLARNTFARALASEHPLPSPALQPRSAIHGQFRDCSEDSQENRLRHLGVTDRHEGAQTIERWQRDEIAGIDRKMRHAIDQLREDYEEQIKQDSRDWANHKDKHDRLRDEARKELGLPAMKARVQEQQHDEPLSERDQLAHEIAEIGRRDDDLVWEDRDQYGNEVIDRTGTVELGSPPESSVAEAAQARHDRPALEPDDYVPEHCAEADFDREMGD